MLFFLKKKTSFPPSRKWEADKKKQFAINNRSYPCAAHCEQIKEKSLRVAKPITTLEERTQKDLLALAHKCIKILFRFLYLIHTNASMHAQLTHANADIQTQPCACACTYTQSHTYILTHTQFLSLSHTQTPSVE